MVVVAVDVAVEAAAAAAAADWYRIGRYCHIVVDAVVVSDVMSLWWKRLRQIKLTVFVNLRW